MRRRGLMQSGLALAFVVVLLLIAVWVPDKRVLLVNTFLAYGALVLSLDLMVGDLNLLPAGHAAFFGAGAYGSVLLNDRYDWPLPVAALVTIAACAVVAAIIGLPVVGRTSGMAFAVVTFAIGVLMVQIVLKFPTVLGGAQGMAVKWGLGSRMPFGFSIYRYFSLWLVLAFAVTLLVVVWVRNSHFGLRLTAIRDDENGARSLGFNPVVYKTLAFALASALAAGIGTVWAPMVGFVGPDLMGVNQSLFLLSLLIIGGIRSIGGGLAGVVLLMALPTYLDLGPTLRITVVGGALVVISLLEPRGLAGLVTRGWRLVPGLRR
jgi:branched-chain amino acid transport system permease protein